MASLDQAVEIFLLLNGSSLVFLEFGLEMAVPHFDAYLSPEPHGSHGSPDLTLVQGGHKGVHNLHGVLEGLVFGLTLLMTLKDLSQLIYD